MIVHRARGRARRTVVVPESPGRTAGRINWLAAAAPVGLAGRAAAPGQPGAGLGLDVAAASVGLLLAAVLLAVAWIGVESRATYPLIDMRMMRRRGVWTTNLVALLSGSAMYASFAFLPQFLQTPPSAGYGFGATRHRVRADDAAACGHDVRRRVTVRRSRWLSGSASKRGAARVGLRAQPRSRTWPSPSSMTSRGRSSLSRPCSWASASAWPSPTMSSLIVAAVPQRADRRGQRDERQHPHHRRLGRGRR